jgi:kynurenine 3-monooxygenase
MKKEVSIIGAGLVGSLLSLFLSRRGYKVSVFERRQDSRKTGAYQGRSINLALSDRGWLALEKAGIAQDIRNIATPMYGRMMHDSSGKLQYQAYGKANQAIYSVSRSGINMALMNLAEKEKDVQMHFNTRCDKISFDTLSLSLTNTESNTHFEHKAELIFGADGAFSATRLSKQLSTDRFEYKQYYINCDYKELYIPPGPDGAYLMDKNALHIWPRGHFMMIALPNADGSFTCTLFFPHEGPESFSEADKMGAKKFFEKHFPDAIPLMPTLEEDYTNNPVSSLVTVKCSPWTNKKNFALIGDAAHAIVPFFGQGMNCGFEDCYVLDNLIEKHLENWEDILPAYEQLRKPDADAIADLAIGNFYEMSDKVKDKQFLLQKKIEAWFSEKHPDLWIPAYSMVTFSPHIRYSDALKNGQRQQAIMDKLMAHPKIEEEWNSEATEAFLLAAVKAEKTGIGAS